MLRVQRCPRDGNTKGGDARVTFLCQTQHKNAFRQIQVCRLSQFIHLYIDALWEYISRQLINFKNVINKYASVFTVEQFFPGNKNMQLHQAWRLEWLCQQWTDCLYLYSKHCLPYIYVIFAFSIHFITAYLFLHQFPLCFFFDQYEHSWISSNIVSNAIQDYFSQSWTIVMLLKVNTF